MSRFRSVSFDQKCSDLADHFLQDLPWVKFDRADDLAATIQQAVEDWIQNEESNQEITDARTDEDMKTHAE